MNVDQMQALSSFAADATALAIALWAWRNAEARAETMLALLMKMCDDKTDTD